ncbi:MAG: hypothetical protein MZV70_36245 [Desulfobacterales bacterium]|nr:hypothetical protein [Desulfobacterales bacterium]
MEDIRDKVHDMFVQNFDPSESKAPTLREAIERYINLTQKGRFRERLSSPSNPISSKMPKKARRRRKIC